MYILALGPPFGSQGEPRGWLDSLAGSSLGDWGRDGRPRRVGEGIA